MADQMSRIEWKMKKAKEQRQKQKRERARMKAERKYEKELAKQGRTTKSRKTEQDRYREVERKLTWAIVITALLLVVVLLMVFFV